jgi:hypothetical protein
MGDRNMSVIIFAYLFVELFEYYLFCGSLAVHYISIAFPDFSRWFIIVAMKSVYSGHANHFHWGHV